MTSSEYNGYVIAKTSEMQDIANNVFGREVQIGNMGRVEYMHTGNGIEEHLYFNVDEEFEPYNEFKDIDFNFSAFLKFTEACAEGNMTRAMGYVDSIIFPPESVEMPAKPRSLVSKLSSQVEYPLLELYGPRYWEGQGYEVRLINPSKGTIKRIHDVEGREYPVLLTQIVKEGSYSNLIQLDMLMRELGWKKPVEMKTWEDLRKDEQKSKIMYYSGFSVAKAMENGIVNCIGFEINPMAAIRAGVQFHDLVDNETNLTFRYVRSDYESEEVYEKNPRYNRYCYDVLPEHFKIRARRYQEKSIGYVHNLMCSKELSIERHSLMTPVFPCDLRGSWTYIERAEAPSEPLWHEFDSQPYVGNIYQSGICAANRVDVYEQNVCTEKDKRVRLLEYKSKQEIFYSYKVQGTLAQALQDPGSFFSDWIISQNLRKIDGVYRQEIIARKSRIIEAKIQHSSEWMSWLREYDVEEFMRIKTTEYSKLELIQTDRGDIRSEDGLKYTLFILGHLRMTLVDFVSQVKHYDVNLGFENIGPRLRKKLKDDNDVAADLLM